MKRVRLLYSFAGTLVTFALLLGAVRPNVAFGEENTPATNPGVSETAEDPVDPPAAACDTSASLLITEIQAGVTGSATSEFIELFNYGAQAVDLAGCSLLVSNGSDSSIITVPLSGVVAAGDYALAVNKPYYDQLFAAGQLFPGAVVFYTANAVRLGGYIKVAQADGSVITSVGFKDLTDKTYLAAPKPDTNYAVKRCSDQAGLFSNTTADADDFLLTGKIGEVNEPLSFLGKTGTLCPLYDNAAPDPEEATEPPHIGVTCEGVAITEVLPNPAGSDTGHEFIELWNPTDKPVSLHHCSLKTTGSSREYEFGDGDVLQPNEYRAFYDTVTSLTLSNAAGGTVWLLSPNEEVASTSYPGSLSDDVAWAQFDEGWSPTFALTPSGPNIFMASKPCPAGQIRSESTGRCVSSVLPAAVTGLAPCVVGQERNPATNRCRSVLGATTSLTPCKEGQYRNPETNRCKNIETASAELTPCKEGQERNPDTNRCRNVVTAASSVEPYAVAATAAQPASKTGWLIAGIAAACALGYGAYEWRSELGRMARKVIPGKK